MVKVSNNDAKAQILDCCQSEQKLRPPAVQTLCLRGGANQQTVVLREEELKLNLSQTEAQYQINKNYFEP